MDKTLNIPEVSVIMPVYNGGSYLNAAIDSVLSQTYMDFELILINDGSTDDSFSIIKSYKDPRIIVVNNEENIRLIATLNKGIKLAKGKYIIRMDCDDICHPNRFMLQVAFMNNNEDIGASGCFFNLLVNGRKVKMDSPLTPEEIDCFLIFNSPLAHPTAIIRRSVLTQHQLNYTSGYLHAEDYFLWSQLNKYSKLANIPHYLLDYRVHTQQVTKLAEAGQEKYNALLKIRAEQLHNLRISFTDTELSIHQQISDGSGLKSPSDIDIAETWLLRIVKHNHHIQALNSAYLNKIVIERWIRLCIATLGLRKGFFRAIKSDIYTKGNLPMQLKYQLFHSFYKSFRRKRATV